MCDCFRSYGCDDLNLKFCKEEGIVLHNSAIVSTSVFLLRVP